jgi:hypothetical protein
VLPQADPSQGRNAQGGERPNPHDRRRQRCRGARHLACEVIAIAKIFTFPGETTTTATPIPDAESELTRGERLYGLRRSREAVQRDIEAHVTARRQYSQAVAWVATAEAEGLPAANIEAARQKTAVLYAEMQDAARRLLIATPTDPKGLATC